MTPEEFMKKFESAGKNLDRALELVADDALYWFSNGTSHDGKARIAAALKYNFDTIQDDTYNPGPYRWLVKTDDCAVCIYPFHWTGKIAGQPAEGSGRGTTVLQKRDGRWLIVHEHLSKGDV